jgi:hypothetical protein
MRLTSHCGVLQNARSGVDQLRLEWKSGEVIRVSMLRGRFSRDRLDESGSMSKL